MHFVYPQTFCIGIVFNFSGDVQLFQEQLKTMLMQNFWGVNKVHYGGCERSEYLGSKGKLFHLSHLETFE